MIDHKQAWNLWKTCQVDPTKSTPINFCATFILGHWLRYKSVGDKFGIPPYVVGCIHYRESYPVFNFNSHLCNGDPLLGHDGVAIPTIHVPKNLIAANWEDGAVLAFKQVGWDKGHHWDIVNTLENLEAYNGSGYRAPQRGIVNDNRPINSPYVWAMTNQYKIGKFGSDGHYDPRKLDEQVGCAAILMALKAHGVDLNEVAP